MKNRNFQFKNIFVIIITSLIFLGLFAGYIAPMDRQTNKVSYIPLFEIIGVVPQIFNRTLNKVMPIDQMDEAELGLVFKEYYRQQNQIAESDKNIQIYLNKLIQILEKQKSKKFSYEVFLVSNNEPNAMALPGGIILVTTGLMKILKSESEIVSVLSHEMGHIELSHCFESVKFELATKKILNSTIGGVADFAQRILLKHSYSKTQEEEADEFGFQYLKISTYDPSAFFRALSRLQAHAAGLLNSEDGSKSKENLDKQIQNEVGKILRDYLKSHPPLDDRILRFQSDAEIWWKTHEGEKRYFGARNFAEFITQNEVDYGIDEWIDRFIGPAWPPRM